MSDSSIQYFLDAVLTIYKLWLNSWFGNRYRTLNKSKLHCKTKTHSIIAELEAECIVSCQPCAHVGDILHFINIELYVLWNAVSVSLLQFARYCSIVQTLSLKYPGRDLDLEVTWRHRSRDYTIAVFDFLHVLYWKWHKFEVRTV